MGGRVWTVGHGTSSADDIVALLASAGVTAVVDVRRFPGSRRHPHVGAAAMAGWLADAGIDFRGDPRLGGRRPAPPDSPDIWWRVAAFRGYAAHMRTAEFRDGIADLVRGAARRPTAVLCSETLWWRCHRRLIADHLVLVDGVAVTHLLPGPQHVEHVPAAGARRVGGDLVYDAPGG